MVRTFQDKSFLLAFFAVLAIILPGLTAMYVYNPNQVFQLDWIKLVLLSIAFTGPFVVTNSIVIGAAYKGRRSSTSFFLDLVEGALMTAVGFYLCLGILMVFGLADFHFFKFPFANEIILGALAETVLIITIVRENRRKSS